MDESELEARASITAVDGDATAQLNTRQSAERTSKLNSLKERRRAATPPDTRVVVGPNARSYGVRSYRRFMCMPRVHIPGFGRHPRKL
ncbi:hypothetical protein HaLaN_25970, partial [Haematococcus lacustris]